MDQKSSITTQQEGQGFYLAQFKTNELAIFSYYIQSNGQCMLIDPTIDNKVYHDLIQKRKTNLKYVFLTHYHADYISGHADYKTPVVMGKGGKKPTNIFEVTQTDDGTIIKFGSVSIRCYHTPGHTPESASYVLVDGKGKDICLFSGDTVFMGDVGRPDLAVGASLTAEDLASMLYQSIQKLKKLDKSMRLYPGHGAGSACGKNIGTGNFCNLENQHLNNFGFKLTDKAQFVKQLTTGIAKPPSYFFHDAALNQKGSTHYEEMLKQCTKPLSVSDFAAQQSKCAIIDTRPSVTGLVKNSYWLPKVGTIANWLSFICKPEDKYVVICEEGKSEDIIERFIRIGYFNCAGYNAFDMKDWKEPQVKAPECLKFDAVKKEKEATILDVRKPQELQSLGKMQNIINIPLQELEERFKELTDKKNIIIHCATAKRARLAYSILQKYDIESRVFDQEFKNFDANGFKIIK